MPRKTGSQAVSPAIGWLPHGHKRPIDVLTVKDGLIAAIWVVGDEAALLTQLGAGLSECAPPSSSAAP